MEDARSLDRALRLLFELARNPAGLTVTELARRLDTQRPPLYRPLQTLEKYRFIRRDEGKLYHLGSGIVELAQHVSGSVALEVRPILQRVADATSHTIVLVVAEGDDIVTLTSVRPSAPGIYLDTPPGFVHPQGPTAPRIAIQAIQPSTDTESDAVAAARRDGYALTRGVSVEGRTAIAAGTRVGASHQAGAVLLVIDARDESRVAPLPPFVVTAAREISAYYALPG